MFIEPKSPEVRKLVRVCGLMLTPANYNEGQWAPEAAKLPREVKEFHEPHGDEVSEEQLKAAVEAHVQAHGWRLKTVWIVPIFRDFGKRIEPQLAYINERLSFVTNSKAEPWAPEFR